MIIERGSNVFVLRYNDNYMKNMMFYHMEVCKQNGRCWYGKVGKRPSGNKISEFVKDGSTFMIFYNHKAIYLARLMEVSMEMPIKGYPDYYDKSTWKPTSWYLVLELNRVKDEFLDDLIVLSTGKRISETINRSMTSFYFTKSRKTIDMKGEDDA